jgi:hypothetical protein
VYQEATNINLTRKLHIFHSAKTLTSGLPPACFSVCADHGKNCFIRVCWNHLKSPIFSKENK